VHAAAITRGEQLEWPVDRLPAIPSYELPEWSGKSAPRRRQRRGWRRGVRALRRSTATASRPTYTALPAELLVPTPQALGYAESAAIPLPALTACQGLFVHGRLGAASAC
jgi:hypothetical protein